MLCRQRVMQRKYKKFQKEKLKTIKNIHISFSPFCGDLER